MNNSVNFFADEKIVLFRSLQWPLLLLVVVVLMLRRFLRRFH